MAGVPVFSESPISPVARRSESEEYASFSEVGDTTTTPLAFSHGKGTALHGSANTSQGPTSTSFVELGGIKVASQVVYNTSRTATLVSHQPRDHLRITAPRSRTTSPQRSIPPPPKTGEGLRPASYCLPTPDSSLHHNPLPALLPRSATVSRGAPGDHSSASGRNNLLLPTSPFEPLVQTPKSAPIPRKSLEHPPGYVQNPYAADLTPEQRFATQHSPTSPTLGYGSGSGSGSGSGGRILGLRSPSNVFNFGALISPKSPREGVLPGLGDSGTEDIWSVVGGWFKGVSKKVGEFPRLGSTKVAVC